MPLLFTKHSCTFCAAFAFQLQPLLFALLFSVFSYFWLFTLISIFSFFCIYIKNKNKNRHSPHIQLAILSDALLQPFSNTISDLQWKTTTKKKALETPHFIRVYHSSDMCEFKRGAQPINLLIINGSQPLQP